MAELFVYFASFSTDKTFNRIKCILKEKNEGSGPTRNKAINLAKNKYIAFLDSDDIWIPEKLSLHVEFMENNKCAFSHTSYGFIDQNGDTIKKTFHVSNYPISYKDLLKNSYIISYLLTL